MKVNITDKGDSKSYSIELYSKKKVLFGKHRKGKLPEYWIDLISKLLVDKFEDYHVLVDFTPLYSVTSEISSITDINDLEISSNDDNFFLIKTFVNGKAKRFFLKIMNYSFFEFLIDHYYDNHELKIYCILESSNINRLKKIGLDQIQYFNRIRELSELFIEFHFTGSGIEVSFKKAEGRLNNGDIFEETIRNWCQAKDASF